MIVATTVVKSCLSSAASVMLIKCRVDDVTSSTVRRSLFSSLTGLYLLSTALLTSTRRWYSSLLLVLENFIGAIMSERCGHGIFDKVKDASNDLS